MCAMISKEYVFSILEDIRKVMGLDFLSYYEWHDFKGDFDVVKMDDDSEIINLIDHTLLDPAATDNQLRNFCKEALEFEFASICVNPNNVKFCFNIVSNAGLDVCAVAGFPLGAHLSAVKRHEAELAIYDGASEIDMVIDIGALKSRQYKKVFADIIELASICHNQQAILKVIIETCRLDDNEKTAACLISLAAGADFVKTSTGMGGGGAEFDDIRLMRQIVGPDFGVKASGGIRDLERALGMVKVGANRIGAGAGLEIAKELGD